MRKGIACSYLSRNVVDAELAESIQPPRVHSPVPILHEERKCMRKSIVSVVKAGICFCVDELTGSDNTGETTHAKSSARMRKACRLGPTTFKSPRAILARCTHAPQ